MARLLRVEYAGAIHHVTIRGNGRQEIFLDDRDRARFLVRLSQSVELHQVRLYLFCQMSNHVHLVVETPHANLGAFMHSVQTGYSIFFNLRHVRAGHLFQGRYADKLVEGDEYLLKLSRYVHLNPVFAGRGRKGSVEERIGALRCYRWSSYRSYTGLEKPFEFVDYAALLGLIAGGGRRQRQEYRKFVETGIADNDGDFMAALRASRLSIGGSEFREKMWDRYVDLSQKRKRPEDTALRQVGRRIDGDEILDVVAAELGVERSEFLRQRKRSQVRAVAALALCKYGGLSQREAAELLNCGSGAAVSVQLKKLKTALETDRKLKRKIGRIEALLTVLRGVDNSEI
jgi:REP element-mobilizing transposase RayT